MTRSYRPKDLHAAGQDRPLELSAQGFFWTGIEVIDHPAAGKAVRGQQYVEYWIPLALKHTLPIVMIHGGGNQGTDFLGTPDGREGWVKYFVRQGWAVYVVDRPQHGRSPLQPELQGEMSAPGPTEFLERMFTRPQDFPDSYSKAHLHDKWPGSGTIEDPAFQQFLAGAGPSLRDTARAQADAQRAGAELLDKIGPALLLTSSAGAPAGWLIADARPELVRGILAVEPLGPPFASIGGTMPFGITHAPLRYDPLLGEDEELRSADHPSPAKDLVAYKLQAEPARRLPNLCGFPIVVVTAEASWMASDNHAMVRFLDQAGAMVEHLRLEDKGVHGNGHAMQVEVNNDEVARVIEQWIVDKGLGA